MTESVYYGREFIALASSALSVPAISSTFAETSPSASSTTNPGATYGNGARCRELQSLRKTYPYHRDGLPVSIAPFRGRGKYADWEGGNGARL